MTGHKHAAAMFQYYTDALETETPWDRWEMSDDGEYWVSCLEHPQWGEMMQYRRKPKIILINGFEVPEPLREMPNYGDLVWLTHITAENPVSFTLTEGRKKLITHWLQLGLLHTTTAAARTHMQALFSFTKQES